MHGSHILNKKIKMSTIGLDFLIEKVIKNSHKDKVQEASA